MNIPSNPNDLRVLRDMIVEASGRKTRIEAHQDGIKDIADRAKEEFEMKKSEFNKLVNLYHQQNVDVFIGQAEEIKDAYDSVFVNGEKTQESE